MVLYVAAKVSIFTLAGVFLPQYIEIGNPLSALRTVAGDCVPFIHPQAIAWIWYAYSKITRQRYSFSIQDYWTYFSKYPVHNVDPASHLCQIRCLEFGSFTISTLHRLHQGWFMGICSYRLCVSLALSSLTN